MRLGLESIFIITVAEQEFNYLVKYFLKYRFFYKKIRELRNE